MSSQSSPSTFGPSTSLDGVSYSERVAMSHVTDQERAAYNYNEEYPISTYSPAIPSSVNNRVMRQAAAGLLFTSSFDSTKQSALEQITQLLTSYMISICQETKKNCELAGRTIPIASDVWLGLINLGHNVDDLPRFIGEMANGNLVIPPPKSMQMPPQLQPLRVGKTRGHPSHINDFFPPFPDPHTYIRTEISGEPDTSYERVRELAAQRKRDTEQTLVDFMLRIHPRTCLFRDYENRIKEEARLALHDRERQKEALKAAQRQARAVELMKNEVKTESGLEMPDNIMEEDFLERDGGMLQASHGSDDEMDFELEETETSLVLKKIPAYCNVLDPSLESRPYLSALVSEELQDDEQTEAKGAAAKAAAAAAAGQSGQQNKDGEETSYDNAFLRPPRMPTKGSFVQF